MRRWQGIWGAAASLSSLSRIFIAGRKRKEENGGGGGGCYSLCSPFSLSVWKRWLGANGQRLRDRRRIRRKNKGQVGMAPEVVRLSDDANAERRLERQMGCMAGLLQIFDRNQFLAGKRVGSPKRLPSVVQSPAGDDHPADLPVVSSVSPLWCEDGSDSGQPVTGVHAGERLSASCGVSRAAERSVFPPPPPPSLPFPSSFSSLFPSSSPSLPLTTVKKKFPETFLHPSGWRNISGKISPFPLLTVKKISTFDEKEKF